MNISWVTFEYQKGPMVRLWIIYDDVIVTYLGRHSWWKYVFNSYLSQGHTKQISNGLCPLTLILKGVTKYLLSWPQMGKQENITIKNNMLILFTFFCKEWKLLCQNLTFKLLLKSLSKITFSFVHNTHKHLLCATSIWRIATIK